MNIGEKPWGVEIRPGPTSPEEDLRTKSRIGKHVSELKRTGKTTGEKIAATCLAGAELVAGTVSIVGLPVVVEGVKAARLIDRYRAFEAAQKIPPPQEKRISLKSQCQTFNYAFEYVIHEKSVWRRELGRPDSQWQEVYFDGDSEIEPIEIQADGANLMILDNKRRIHYKKILTEERTFFEIEAQKTRSPSRRVPPLAEDENYAFMIKKNIIWIRSKDNNRSAPFYHEGWPEKVPEALEIKSGLLIITTNENQIIAENILPDSVNQKLAMQTFPCRYHYSPLTAVEQHSADGWKKAWYSVPVVGALTVLKRNRKLKIPPGALWTCSERGKYNGAAIDSAGCEHPNQTSVTTVYAVFPIKKKNDDANEKIEYEKRILFADPWVLFGFHRHSYPGVRLKEIALPENFEIEGLDAAASFILITGRSTDGTIEMYILFEDFDMGDYNPTFTYMGVQEYEAIEDKSTIDPAVRVIPDNYPLLKPGEKWRPVSTVGLESQSVSLATGCIIQKGFGNESKEFRMGSVDDPLGERGYYRKFLDRPDEGWEFIDLENPD